MKTSEHDKVYFIQKDLVIGEAMTRQIFKPERTWFLDIGSEYYILTYKPSIARVTLCYSAGKTKKYWHGRGSSSSSWATTCLIVCPHTTTTTQHHPQEFCAAMHIKTPLDNAVYFSSLWSDLSMWGHFLIVLNLRNPNLRSEHKNFVQQ